MANADRPCGFKPYGSVLKAVKMEAGSACYPGDAVSLASDGQVDPSSANAAILGVALNYAAAAGDPVMVSIDPSQLYEVQADTSEVNAQTFVGNCADIVATAGDSTLKISRQELDASAAAAGASQQLLIMGLVPRPDNAWGEFAKLIVKINETQAEEDFAGI